MVQYPFSRQVHQIQALKTMVGVTFHHAKRGISEERKGELDDYRNSGFSPVVVLFYPLPIHSIRNNVSYSQFGFEHS